MAEAVEVYVKGVELETDKGQGIVKMVLGPMAEKEARRLSIVGSGGKMRVILE